MILVGDPSVGKTHLLSRYTRGVLPRDQSTTIGVELATHTVPLAVGGTVRIQIWDTGELNSPLPIIPRKLLSWPRTL